MYLLTNDEKSKLGTIAAARRRRARVPRQRPGRPVVPHAAVDQVHPDRRQDRAEPRPRSGSDLRADQAPLVRATTSGCSDRQPASCGKVGGDARDQGERAASPAGTTTRSITAADPQLHRQADRSRNPPHAAGPRRLPQPARAEAARLSDGRSHRQGRRRQDGPTCCSSWSASKAPTPSRTT